MRIHTILLVLLVFGMRTLAIAQSTTTDSQEAVVRGSGCVEAGIEGGCFVLHDLKTNKTFTLFFKGSSPKLDTAISFEGTENSNPNICMQGKAVDVTKWTAIRLHCQQPSAEGKTAEVAASTESKCNNWSAWYDVQPTAPKSLHVAGLCTFPTSGYGVKLVPRVPQGINSTIYIFDVVITPPKGNVSHIPRHIQVHYTEKTEQTYGSVDLEPDHVTVPVKIIQ